MMKKCSKCGIEKPDTAEFFYKHPRGANGLSSYCKECQKTYENTPACIKRRRGKKRTRNRKTKKRLIEHFGGKCVTCGYDRCLAGFDFHHIDPKTKEFGISEGLHLNVGFKNLVKEAKKCMLLCSNCHRELHYNESEEH